MGIVGILYSGNAGFFLFTPSARVSHRRRRPVDRGLSHSAIARGSDDGFILTPIHAVSEPSSSVAHSQPAAHAHRHRSGCRRRRDPDLRLRMLLLLRHKRPAIHDPSATRHQPRPGREPAHPGRVNGATPPGHRRGKAAPSAAAGLAPGKFTGLGQAPQLVQTRHADVRHHHPQSVDWQTYRKREQAGFRIRGGSNSTRWVKQYI